MNYQQHYNTLIERAKTRLLEGYSEQHHVVPRCLGGSDDVDNLVGLTPEEHYVAHQLLVKIHPDENGLIYAAMMMGGTRKGNKIYGWLRREYIRVMTIAQTGTKRSKETRLKMSEAQLGIPKSDAHRAAISAAKKGKPSNRLGATQAVTSGAWKKGNTPWNVGKPAYEYAIEINGTVYESRKKASIMLNKDITTIHRWLKNGKALDRSVA